MSSWSKFLVVGCVLGLAGCAARPSQLGPAELYWLLNDACYSGDEIAVKMLLNAGADPTGVQGYEAFYRSPYMTQPFEPSWPINQAASGGHAAVVRLLLAAGAKPDAPEGEGQTALLIAANRGDLDTVRLLLQSGASRSYRAAWLGGDSPGTAEEVATRAGHVEVADFIRNYGRAQ